MTQGLPIRDRLPASVTASRRLTKGDRHFTALIGVRLLRAQAAHSDLAASRGTSISWTAGNRVLQRPRKYRWTGAATPAQQKHHPSSGTTEKGK